jgi:hypothetical protein
VCDESFEITETVNEKGGRSGCSRGIKEKEKQIKNERYIIFPTSKYHYLRVVVKRPKIRATQIDRPKYFDISLHELVTDN